MIYEMKNNTLPVHLFCEFSMQEVTSRMECLSKGSEKACMDYCNIVQTQKKTTLIEKFECYEKFNISISLYGKELCDYTHPR